MAGTATAPVIDAGAGFDAIVAVINSASPDAFYQRATAFDRASERLEDILKRFQNVSRDLQHEWAGLVANAYTGLAGKISTGTSSVVDAMLSPGWAKQLRAAGDALAVGQSRIRDLSAQRAAITDPAQKVAMEPQFVAAAQQILESVSSSYQQAGNGMTALLAGTTSGSGASDGSDPDHKGQSGTGQPEVVTVAYSTPLVEVPPATGGAESFGSGGVPGNGAGGQGAFSQFAAGHLVVAGGSPRGVGGAVSAAVDPSVDGGAGGMPMGTVGRVTGGGGPGGTTHGFQVAAHVEGQPDSGAGAFAVSRFGVPGVVGQPSGGAGSSTSTSRLELPGDVVGDEPGSSGFLSASAVPSMPGRPAAEQRRAAAGTQQKTISKTAVQQPDGGVAAGQRDDALAVIAAGASGPAFSAPQQTPQQVQLPQQAVAHAVAGGPSSLLQVPAGQQAFAQAAAGNLPSGASGSGVVGSASGSALTGLSAPSGGADARLPGSFSESPRAGGPSWSNPVTTASAPIRPLTTDLSTVAGGSPMLPGSGSGGSGRAGLPLDHLANNSPMPMGGMGGGGMGGMGMGTNQQERETDRRYDVAFFDEDAEAWGAQDGAPPAIGRPERQC